ncbi:YbaB/EbfC family nucleoid-associated protein [Streptoalloteichus hindustanus]|uniref:Conserved DNA-binding protein YbaB n=1 Tax=Streptoalloteichus hindustanus TaxID=2017 RepID=A0A1M5N9H8_STRHI|nr:YbaB/EbfC family nucleoid-associated protein [Streptoalloteichus hindustanus]SHG85663.1 Conserved DNA-binding protein YbaB [Streptoalloteichus hindustanus]
MDRGQRFNELMRTFEEQATKASTLRDALKDLKGTAQSRDGAVTVTVAPSGAVVGLQLSPRAMQKSHVALQQEILQTIREATSNAAQQVEETVAPVLGDELMDRFRQGIGSARVEAIQPDASPAPQPERTPPPAPRHSAPEPTWSGQPPTAPPPPPARPQRNQPAPIDDEEPPGSFLS